jgi:uncharacterized membrane protein YphA (DoxX/SURF4 family)
LRSVAATGPRTSSLLNVNVTAQQIAVGCVTGERMTSMHNPIADLVAFLFGASPDYNPLGLSRYIYVIFYIALLAGSAFIAWKNWQLDPTQRKSGNIWIWLMRVLAAGMWYQGTFWKLPRPVSQAFTFWTGALVKFGSFGIHESLVRAIFVPHINLLQPVVYLTEIFFTVALTLGVFVRLAGLIAVVFTAQLWLGLYNDPTEWPWTYIAIIIAHGMFVAAAAGRSLGLDNLIRRNNIVTSRPALRQALELAS